MALFNLSIFKNWASSGGAPWVNTYHLETTEDDGPASASLLAAGLDVVQAEQAVHRPAVYFDRYVISTYSPDSTPYNPETFVVVSIGFNGLRPAGDDAVDLNAVWKVRRDTATGRPGKIAYRGVLGEADIQANASGYWQINPGSPLNSGGGEDWDAYMLSMASVLAGGAAARMVVITPGDGVTRSTIVRNVQSLSPVGAGYNKMKHKFFDRS